MTDKTPTDWEDVAEKIATEAKQKRTDKTLAEQVIYPIRAIRSFDHTEYWRFLPVLIDPGPVIPISAVVELLQEIEDEVRNSHAFAHHHAKDIAHRWHELKALEDR